MRRSSTQAIDVAISREIQSDFDSVKLVADNIDKVVLVADLDIAQVGADIAVINQDITEIQNVIASGGLVGPQGVQGSQGVQGIQGIIGPQGLQGARGVRGYTIKPTFTFTYDPVDGDINVVVVEQLYDDAQILNEYSLIQPREV